METPNSRGNAESTLACHRKSFSCSWCARWTMARKHSRTNRHVSFPLPPPLSLSLLSATCTLPRKYSTCTSVALHEAARSATRVRRQCLLNVFFFPLPLFFLDRALHRSRSSLPGWKRARTDLKVRRQADKSSAGAVGALCRKVLTPLARGSRENGREGGGGTLEMEFKKADVAECVEEAMLFTTSF